LSPTTPNVKRSTLALVCEDEDEEEENEDEEDDVAASWWGDFGGLEAGATNGLDEEVEAAAVDDAPWGEGLTENCLNG
jgi:hypothetical protein